MEFFTQATALAALAVVVVEQILKLKVIPNGFANRYPVPTLIILSIVASIIVAVQTGVNPNTWTDWLVLTGLVTVSAAVTYNTVFKNWSELRSLEGEK